MNLGSKLGNGLLKKFVVFSTLLFHPSHHPPPQNLVWKHFIGIYHCIIKILEKSGKKPWKWAYVSAIINIIKAYIIPTQLNPSFNSERSGIAIYIGAKKVTRYTALLLERERGKNRK